MTLLADLTVVFVAGLITALATGVGALPFFLFDEITERTNVFLWGLASGIMVSASLFGLVDEGLSEGTPAEIAVGALVGVALVVVAHEIILDADLDPRDYEEADFKKLVLILGILTVHSFPEGIAVGVSFADLGLEGGAGFLGFTVPLLAVFMTLAISGSASDSPRARWSTSLSRSSYPRLSKQANRSAVAASPNSPRALSSASRRWYPSPSSKARFMRASHLRPTAPR